MLSSGVIHVPEEIEGRMGTALDLRNHRGGDEARPSVLDLDLHRLVDEARLISTQNGDCFPIRLHCSCVVQALHFVVFRVHTPVLGVIEVARPRRRSERYRQHSRP